MSDKKKVGISEREKKSHNFLVRLYPSTRKHLEAMSDQTGYTMTSLVEYAIMGLRAEQFPDAPGLGRQD